MSILQSIKPQYCELIASGKKTIEVRKTKPKCELPVKVYIYCTKDKEIFYQSRYTKKFTVYKPKFYKDTEILLRQNGHTVFNGKVIGEYVCDEIEECRFDYLHEPPFQNIKCYLISDGDLKQTCLTYEELNNYGNGKPLYLWHISNLVIYDKPKELSEFSVIDKDKLALCPYRERIFQNPELTNGNYLYGGYSCSKVREPDFDDIDFCRGGCADVFKPLTHPPQSW